VSRQAALWLGLAVVAVLALVLGVRQDRPRAPVVAAAANLDPVLTEIADRFATERGTRVDVVFGASGALTRQIEDGAPFELFLAADEAFPHRLTAAGLTRDAGVVYAVGRLAIFAPAGSPLAVDPELDGLSRLLDSGMLDRFAIANPDVAPYGRAAEAVMRARGLWNPIRPHLVLGESVVQAFQFAATGNTAGGLVAYSLVVTPGQARRGTHALIPDGDHPPLRQRMVLLERAGPVAEQFYGYVQGDAARAIFEAHGYGAPR
jgi:molybdate transport system substrate-binding protein